MCVYFTNTGRVLSAEVHGWKVGASRGGIIEGGVGVVTGATQRANGGRALAVVLQLPP